MTITNRSSQFYRNLRDTRRAFTNLKYVFDTRKDIVLTSHEFIAGLSILTTLILLILLIFKL